MHSVRSIAGELIAHKYAAHITLRDDVCHPETSSHRCKFGKKRKRQRLAIINSLIACALLALQSGCRVHPEIAEENDFMLISQRTTSALRNAYATADDDLITAIDRSIVWLQSDEGIDSYDHIEAHEYREHCIVGLISLRQHLEEATSADDFVRRVCDEGLVTLPREQVLFTGYFAPQYEASRLQTDQFTVPLYTLPNYLQGDRSVKWRTRSEIENNQLLAGRELVWLADPLDAFLIHVNGSARLRMTDGTVMHVGHSGTNNLEYTSIGRLMIDDGRATADEMSMQTIRRIYEEDPTYVLGLIAQNDRYVFFEEINANEWPRGGMGMVITPMRSAAVDPKYYPPGSILLVVTELATPDGGFEPFVQLMVAQDVGGAIKGPGRIDLFIGVGDEAGETAGRQVAEGVVYPLILDPKIE